MNARGQTNRGPGDQGPGTRAPKLQGSLLADEDEATVAAPAAAEPAAAQTTPRAAPVEAEDARTADIAPHRLMKEDNRELTLHVGVLGAEPEAILIGRTFEPLLRRFLDRIFGADVASEVEDDEIALDDQRVTNWKSLLRDEVVLPVVLAGSDEALERFVTTHGDRKLDPSPGRACRSKDQVDALVDDVRTIREHERNVVARTALREHSLFDLDSELEPNCTSASHGELLESCP